MINGAIQGGEFFFRGGERSKNRPMIKATNQGFLFKSVTVLSNKKSFIEVD